MLSTMHVATGVQNLKGNEVLAMIQQTEEGTMVAVKPLCTHLRLNWGSQAEKLSSDPRFSCTDISMVGADGKKREMICLPAEQVPMWINSINSNKVAAEKRQALLDLHKFFGHALNEFSRDRFVTREEMNAKIKEVMGIVQQLLEKNAALEATNASLWKARNYEATSASYGLLSAKARKKATQAS